MVTPGSIGNIIRAGAGTTILTGADSDYGGYTAVQGGKLIVGANVFEGQNGPLGNATGINAVIQLGNTSGTSDAGFYINAAGVTVGRPINVLSGNTGISTIGGTNTSGTATFAGNILLGSGDSPAKGVTLSAAEGGTVEFTGAFKLAEVWASLLMSPNRASAKSFSALPIPIPASPPSRKAS